MAAERASPLWTWDAGPNWLGEVYLRDEALEWVANSKIPPGGWGYGLSKQQPAEDFLSSGPCELDWEFSVPVHVIEDLRRRLAPGP
jgi:hypothetical protein